MTEIDNADASNEEAAFDEQQMHELLTQIGLPLGITIDLSDVHAAESIQPPGTDFFVRLRSSGQQAGLFIDEVSFGSEQEAIELVRAGTPVILVTGTNSCVVLQNPLGRGIEATAITKNTKTFYLSGRKLRKMLRSPSATRTFIVNKELECDLISSANVNRFDQASIDDDHHDSHSIHMKPLPRFIGLLEMDRRDIGSVILFAFVSGVLSLATPLAVESLVNVVSWGTYLQPLIILGLMLLTCLGLAGILKVLQTFVVEIIQRRQFVRIISDLAHRFPRAAQESLVAEHRRELANRVFDIMTIQKATAVLLLDGVSIVLTTIIGLVLLAFYHPFLLGFDILLVITMVATVWLLGQGGIRTSIAESITKYKVAHWLQDVLAFPTVFKTGGGESLAVSRANQLTAEYIVARQRQFRVVIRQVIFAVGLQVIASTALLALGGWLVIEGQLTLGQLVASELVVTVVVGAFAKAGKSLEKFYDLMAGIDKVGHLLDIKTDHRHNVGPLSDGPIEASWTDLIFRRPTSESRLPASKIAAGDRVAVIGGDIDGCSDLAKTLAGLAEPTVGLVQVAGFDALQAATGSDGQLIGYAGDRQIFHGTVRENIDLGRSGIGHHRLREVLKNLGLADAVQHLDEGLESTLQTDGYPMTQSQVDLLTLARAIAPRPKLLVINGLLDRMDSQRVSRVWEHLSDPDAPWTLVVITHREDIADRCDNKITVRPTENPTL